MNMRCQSHTAKPESMARVPWGAAAWAKDSRLSKSFSQFQVRHVLPPSAQLSSVHESHALQHRMNVPETVANE